MYSSPAYTTVSARRNFDHLEPSSPSYIQIPQSKSQPEAPKSQPGRVWPVPVRQYVQRAFAVDNAIPGIGRPEMEAKLKSIISDAASANALDTMNWETLLLPQQMIQEDRKVAFRSPGFPPASIEPTSATFSKSIIVKTNESSHADGSKKRKSSDLAHDDTTAFVSSPWRMKHNNVLLDRSPVTEKRQRIDTNTKQSKSQPNLESRRRRFEGMNGPSSPAPYLTSQEDIASALADKGPVVGKCQNLEKKYFRLTSAPNPESVRPLPVLEKTLVLLKEKWRAENNYSYICDQFKSLRQDLTVQHIKNDFTVNVYEIHARIALEKGDLGEYNQCQTQLRGLYKQKIGGHPTEFKAYRILYFIHTCNRTDMNDVLADLTPAEKKAPPIKHALDARSALALGNYHKFFQLYLDVPNMGAYLMDMFISRERLAALANICRAYKPDVKLRFITEELGFESDEEAARFIIEYGAQPFLEDQETGVRLLTGNVGNIFEVARQSAFKKVDIKGQI